MRKNRNGKKATSSGESKVVVRGTVETLGLSSQDAAELAECEQRIRHGWETFVDVGNALARIRDRQLYQAQFKTFEEYCRVKWDFRKSHSYRLIAAAEVAGLLSPMGDVPQPVNERQVRPLIGLPAGEVRKIWRLAAERADGEGVRESTVRAVLKGFVPVSTKFKKQKPGKTEIFREIRGALAHLGAIQVEIEGGNISEMKGHLSGAIENLNVALGYLPKTIIGDAKFGMPEAGIYKDRQTVRAV